MQTMAINKNVKRQIDAESARMDDRVVDVMDAVNDNAVGNVVGINIRTVSAITEIDGVDVYNTHHEKTGAPLHYIDDTDGKRQRFDIGIENGDVTAVQWDIMIHNESWMLTDNQIRLLISALFPFRYDTKKSPDGRFGFPLSYVNGMRRDMNTAKSTHSHRGRADGQWFRKFEIRDGVPVAVTDGHGEKIVFDTVPETDTKQLS